MTTRTVRVVKVGGSLFDMAGLPDALRQWLTRQTPAFHILVAGGGAMADCIRQADRLFHLDAAAAHWMCVDVLTASAKLLAALVPQARFIPAFAELQAELQHGSESAIVFAVEDFLRNHEAMTPGPALPRDWRVTSDSIAARLAQALNADEVVLLKSIDLPSKQSRTSASAAGLVDNYFPVASQSLRSVRWVNLRDIDGREAYLPH